MNARLSPFAAILPVLMRRLPVPIALLLALLALAPAASAQLPDTDPPDVAPKQKPRVQAKPGELTLSFRNGLRKEGRVYLTKGQRVKIRGRARPFVRGQYVRINMRRNGKTVASKVRKLRKHGRRGHLVVRFKPREQGAYSFRARHKRTKRQLRFKAREHARVLDNTAGVGSRGIRVTMLQRGLKRLGYAGFTPTGYFGPGTARAVLAFHKVNHMPRIGFASREVFQKVFERRGTFRLKYPRAGKHIEADLSRQVLVLANHGKAQRIYHTSSGKAVNSDSARLVPGLPQEPGHELTWHGPLELLHRRLRDPRLPLGAHVPGEPRLPAGADPECLEHLQLGRLRHPRLRLPIIGAGARWMRARG